MIAPLAKFIDWSVLQAAAMLPSIRKCARGDSKLTEAIEFLNGPDFIPAESKPAELEFKSETHFTFPSSRPCEFAENNIVHGRLYRRAKDWQKFPTLILLHGGGDYLSQWFGFPLIVPAIQRAGFNAATLTAPYHFQRRVCRIGRVIWIFPRRMVGRVGISRSQSRFSRLKKRDDFERPDFFGM